MNPSSKTILAWYQLGGEYRTIVYIFYFLKIIIILNIMAMKTVKEKRYHK